MKEIRERERKGVEREEWEGDEKDRGGVPSIEERSDGRREAASLLSLPHPFRRYFCPSFVALNSIFCGQYHHFKKR